MSTRQVLGTIGFIVGAYFGAPQLGYMIGSAIGGAIDPEIIKGPSVGDIVDQTSMEGGPRPFCYALSKPIAGNIIAQGPPRVVKKRKSQGKGGPKVETESVYRTYAIGVIEGEKELVRAWRNGQLVYDISEFALLTNAENDKFLDTARWFNGSFTQEPSPDLETIFGVGTTPAHRGTAYMVQADEDLTDLRGAIPQWTFQVGDIVAPAFSDPILLLRFDGQADGSTTFEDESIFHHSVTRTGNVAIDTDDFVCGTGSSQGTSGQLHVPHHSIFNTAGSDFTISGWFKVEEGGDVTFFEKLGFTTLYPYKIQIDGTGIQALGGVGIGEPWSAGSTAYNCFAAVDVVDGEWHHLALERWGAIFTLFVDGVPFADAGNPGAGIDPGEFNGNLASNTEQLSIAQTTGGAAYDDMYMTLQALYHGEAFTPPSCIEGSITLDQVVTDICDRAGLPASLIDVSELAGIPVRGFTGTNQYPALSALRALSEVFFFDPAPVDGKVKFIRRGHNTVATITEDDFLDDEEEIEQSTRKDSISIPRVVHLNYHDIAGGMATDKQSSERPPSPRAVGELSTQSAVIMSADEAARVVAINHKVMADNQRGELKFQLAENFIGLIPTDTVILQWQGRSVRARIDELKIDDGSQEYLARYDRQSAYVSNVEGIPAAPQTPPPSNVVGPTLIEPLDIHILQDADDAVGLSYYVAVSGLFDAWQGAQVELSFDGGVNYIDSADTRTAAIMGTLLTELPDHPAETPDETNTVQVRITTPSAELEEVTLEDLLSDDTNLCIIGDELVQFAGVDEIAEGDWELSVMLRGRKGTASVAHAIGERFVLLDRGSLALIPAGLTDIGRTFTFRATSFGTTVDSGTVVSMIYAGRSQIEREAAYLAAHRDGSSAVVSWQGVGRLGAGITTAHGARFAGYRVTFDDGVTEETVDTDAETLTHDVSGFGSPITISVAQLNDLTGAGPEIEVVLT